MGMVAGTGIGGLLAQPALHYPDVFSPQGLFGRCGFNYVALSYDVLKRTRREEQNER